MYENSSTSAELTPSLRLSPSLCSLLAVLLAAALWAVSSFASENQANERPFVVLLSLDGFRADYLDRYPNQSTNLKRLADSGLAATGLVPGFPSSTFPNHYSIVTGLYPGRHGIIGNGFYDRSRDARYRLGDRNAVEDGTWYGGEPLWVAVEKAGMRAASYFWVGSEADVQGIRPSYYKIYDGSIPNHKRVDQVLDWLRLPIGERPNFVTLYFSTVDSAGHRYGPDSTEVKQAVASVDKQVGRLVTGLARIDHPVYLMVSSDHGMQQVDADQTVFLAEVMALGRWRGSNQIISGGAYAFFYSDDVQLVSQTFDDLKRVDGLTVLRPAQFPDVLNFPQSGPRIPDLVAVVEAPKYIGFHRGKGRKPPQGAHGYLTATTPTMKGIFFATGPGIAPNTQVPDVDNVHIYPLVLSLLGIPNSRETDGDLSVLGSYLMGQAE
jgi:alkaline phosphatase D